MMKRLSQPCVCYQAPIRLLFALCDANHTGSIELYLPYQNPSGTHNYCLWDQSNVDGTLLSTNIPFKHTQLEKHLHWRHLDDTLMQRDTEKCFCFTCKTAMKNYLDLVSSAHVETAFAAGVRQLSEHAGKSLTPNKHRHIGNKAG